MIISANTLLAPGDGDVGAHAAPPSPAAFFSSLVVSSFVGLLLIFSLAQQLINVHIILGVIQSR
ncbi:Alkaline phosphatase-like alpha/beta/alpha [Penicillium hordei]|uniref:Alkaline phosphatase-like alpha/beta/alpha n=1 Tax=Penicillium hordei TaxID=40994 RepID=A0AAD6H6Y1_9EURO|nr:Alkaline phosphatase-like alpha/beta/alpha [Penicillium hordei]KAJ5616303.1 Alkaline phosphatase-like alpha/beta/alpha [Penicillium hordei]